MKADLILESNLIFDSIKDKPFHGFIAIKNNKILAVTNDFSQKQAFIDDNTKVFSYQDKVIMPSFFDAHTHLILAGMFKTFVDLGQGLSEEECAKICHDYAQNNAIDGWLIGFNWYNFRWTDKSIPSKKSLDKYFKDIPVLLLNSEAHNGWVNSKALELAGITKDTKDPLGGEIMRDENGEATGFLYESAISLVTPYAFNFSKEQEKQLLQNFMDSALSLGITSLIDVKPYFGCDLGSLEILEDMENNNELNMRVHCAFDLFSDLDAVVELNKKYHTDKIRANFVKQFVDGVIPTHTALMLEGYADEPENKGYPLNELDKFKDAIAEAHKRDLSVKIHAIGDKAIRHTLDCYENAINLHGKSKSRHAIEHCEYVADSDFERFGTLGIIPSVQPEHLGLVPSWDEEPYMYVLGEDRANKTWSFKKLLDSAGVLAIGSDCPVVDNNPFYEIHRGLTRLHDDLLPENGWNPTQKLTIAEILKNYTYGSAFSAHRENELGTLEEGKLADIIVIDGNLFDIDAQEIRNLSVLTTIMDGKIVYNKV